MIEIYPMCSIKDKHLSKELFRFAKDLIQKLMFMFSSKD